MTAYIAMRRDLRDDARVLQIAASCGIPVEHAIGCLHGVWSIADGLSADGQLAHYTDAMIDAKVGVIGFAAAMRAVDWLRDGRNGLLIPRFSRWFGRSAKKRSQDAQRQRRFREKQAKTKGKTAESGGGDRHAPVTRDVTRDSHAAVATVTPLEERRGEEIREEGIKAADPKSAPARRSADRSRPPAEQWASKRPIVFRPESGWSGITDADRAEWAKAYPAVDIDIALAQAGEWCKSAGAKGVKSNWRKFFVGWLKREQDRGGNQSGPRSGAWGDRAGAAGSSESRGDRAGSAADRRRDRAAREYPEPDNPIPIFRPGSGPARGGAAESPVGAARGGVVPVGDGAAAVPSGGSAAASAVG